ncbi:MAG: hypothetical protein AAAC48_21120, partial [Phyllobacterium sp.]|uniref:hypothetical protein n=1 Tax=Phyllobacterium sp. TaxID=1871046 RepID=UPI0030EFE8A8
MAWIGRKKIAFIPLYRPNAMPLPDQIPADWPNQILRRVLFDPDPTIQADRSLRAYIQAASSGRADLDAVVMPMQVLDQQDVPPDVFEGQLGSQLRDEGFNAAALVMLGQPPTGQGELGGFWARFDMSEALGVWAMELMHVLTGFTDLYTFGGNMGPFDNMACGCGTHPSAYTKAAIDWLNASAIAKHTGGTAEYALHAVGLDQPPPSGRWTAIRIGSKVPYLMVEARLMVDQFESKSQLEPGIPSQGVIVYRVQTSDPHGIAQNDIAPIQLLTLTSAQKPTALQVGQAFTSDTHVTVSVTGTIPGGFLVVVRPPLGGLPVRAPVTAVARKPGQLDIWVVAKDGKVWSAAWSEASGWSNWFSLDAPPGGFAAGAPVAAVARKPEQLDIW